MIYVIALLYKFLPIKKMIPSSKRTHPQRKNLKHLRPVEPLYEP